MLSKSTHVYADHGGLPIECDIYTDMDCPEDAPVFLYFHPGGLVDWGRDCIAPWLVQACWQRKWPLISADFRQMPQVGQQGLLEDAKAAYQYARQWNAKNGGSRRVIVGGASGGFFVASLVAHHAQPPPLALFSICGIATFRHPFFNSSTMHKSYDISDSAMAPVIALPLTVGKTPIGSPTSFCVERLLSNGSKNTSFQQPEEEPRPKLYRGSLYEYYIYNNSWLELVGSIDVGYEWAREPENEARVRNWPPTVVFHGDADPDVPLGVSQVMQEGLGKEKVKIFLAPGKGHLFELMSFIEDEQPGMGVVREAMDYLTGIIV